jgi:hypothetical protein
VALVVGFAVAEASCDALRCVPALHAVSVAHDVSAKARVTPRSHAGHVIGSSIACRVAQIVTLHHARVHALGAAWLLLTWASMHALLRGVGRLGPASILVLTLSACSGDDPNNCDDCGGPGPPGPTTKCVSDAAAAGPTVVAGEIDGGAFVALAAGMQVQTHYGAQGGSHIQIAARVFADAGPNMTASIDIADEMGGGASTEVGFGSCGSEWAEIDAPVFGYAYGAAELAISVRTLDGTEVASQLIAIEVLD